MDTESSSTAPIRTVVLALYGWAVFALGISLCYVIGGHVAAWAGVAIGAVSAAIARWAQRSRQWLQPLLAAMYALAIGMVVAGMVTDLDVYVVGGVVSLILLSIGVCLLVRLREVRDAFGRARRDRGD